MKEYRQKWLDHFLRMPEEDTWHYLECNGRTNFKGGTSQQLNPGLLLLMIKKLKKCSRWICYLYGLKRIQFGSNTCMGIYVSLLNNLALLLEYVSTD